MPDRMPEGMPDRMPDRMSDRMPEDMPDKVPECLPDRMPADLPDNMPEDMLDRMPDGMPEDLPDNMPEDMPDRMPDGMPEDMPEHMPEDMPEDMPEHLPEDMPEHLPEDTPGRMPEDMPDRMPDRMPENMSDRMPEDLPVTKCINVMVGITRSKVIFLQYHVNPPSRWHCWWYCFKHPSDSFILPTVQTPESFQPSLPPFSWDSRDSGTLVLNQNSQVATSRTAELGILWRHTSCNACVDSGLYRAAIVGTILGLLPLAYMVPGCLNGLDVLIFGAAPVLPKGPTCC